MQDRHLLVFAIVGILTAGVVVSKAWDAVAGKDQAAETPTAVHYHAERFDPEKIAAMEAQLRREPKIVDLIHASPAGVEWQIGVHHDGTSRIGFAGYVCQQLRSAGLMNATTDVRIVDIDYLRSNPGAFRAASLGHVRCADQSVIAP
ncbi:hypothetical protein [Sphingomonas sp. TX0522]|uniref:hypothetical protein n=1 Tax=Sphingomonas sp. TX0522 TaxID=2479205 RepID=UPI0018DFDCBC|nr:hypothetical protein [Sphingomonas sp. TX0522]MBI0530059.1 hypothetical protein [Sphingomonas sp. TX0522]